MRATRRGVSGGLAAFLLSPLGKAVSPADAQQKLDALFSNLAAARSVGAAYLRSHPADGLVPADLETSRSAVPALVRDDFANGRVVSVDGWMLAVTEARLCALAYLTA